MRILALLLAGAGLFFQSRAATSVPRYEVKRAPSPIILDGKPNEPAWAAAGAIHLISPWQAPGSAAQDTVVRLLWDDNFLYISFACEDSHVTAKHTQRDDPVTEDDSVLFLVNPKPSQSYTYIGLEINARAAYRDYLVVDGQYFFPRFNMKGVRVVTYVDGPLNQPGDKDRGWSLEAAIPWSNFEDLSRQHGAGTTWTANLGRWDGEAPKRTLSLWSDSLLANPSANAIERFGELIFVK